MTKEYQQYLPATFVVYVMPLVVKINGRPNHWYGVDECIVEMLCCCSLMTFGNVRDR